MPRKNAIFFILDAMRYDVAANPEAFRFIAPNIARLAAEGCIRKIVTNAQSTQFVLPSLFTLTYPLDYGGYNNGIRERPKSFVELFREQGYRTCLFSTCNQLGMSNGYDRGFDIIGTTSDYRTQLEHRISRGISYWLGLWQKGEMTNDEFIVFLRRDFGSLLESLTNALRTHDKSIWPRRLHRINQWIGDRCDDERRLLETEPLAVAQKLKRIAPGLYWQFLGQRSVPQWRLFPARVMAAISWRSRKWISEQQFFPLLRLQHYQAIFGDVVDRIADAAKSMRDRPWFLHMHTMDLHDCRAINRPLHLLGRLRYLPRWLRGRRLGLTKRRFLYDSALMYVDAHFGRLLDEFARSGMLDNTVILVTGDHALQFAESPRRKTPIGERMHYEDIEVPLTLFGAPALPTHQQGLLDSRAVTATFLQALSIDPHPSFAKANAYGPGLDVVVSESCGPGASDLARRDIYFGVTGATHRMFGILTGREFHVTNLYDIVADPREINNVAAEPGSSAVLTTYIRRLFEERKDLFRLRGLDAPPLPLIKS